MEFERIQIENFLSSGEIDLILNQPGLILIQGVNKDAPLADSNGAGKSLLLDAICWCIWGKTVRGLTGDAVIRDIFPDGKRTKYKDCCVRLTVRDGDELYIISRHRGDTRIDKPNDLKLFINGVEKGKKVKNLQEIIDRVIGFDFETFCAMMPGTGVRASNMTDSEIKKLLEKILQTENLSAAYAKARTRWSEIRAQLAAEQTQEGKLRQELAALEVEVTQLRGLEQSFEEAKAKRIAQHRQRMQELIVEVEKADKELAALEELKKTRDALIAETVALDDRINRECIEPRNMLLNNYDKSKMDLQEQRADALARFRVIESQLSELTRMGPTCDSCHQHVDAAHKQAQCEKLGAEFYARNEAVERWDNAMAALSLSYDRELKVIYTRRTELTGLLQQKHQGVTILNSQLVNEKLHTASKTRAAQDFAREQKLLKEAEAQSQNFTQIFADKAAKAASLVNELSQILTSIKKFSAEKKLCDFWVEGFSPQGLRSFMLDYVTPILNDRAAYYSEVLTGGHMKVTFSTKKLLKNGEERDEFQITVDQTYGCESYMGVSIGEKARADLIISMALGDLAVYRTAKQLPWRFLDEPFENIDKTGNEAVVNLLNDQKNRYKTVFVITHKPSLQNMFTQRVTVTKDGGISTISTNW